jgi:hypothetical protein
VAPDVLATTECGVCQIFIKVRAPDVPETDRVVTIVSGDPCPAS